MQDKKPAREPVDWDDLRLFLALSRAPTLGEAAARLRIDASTASRRLAQLEQALAVTLFERGRNGIVATKAAEDLLPVAQEIDAMMNRFANAADGLEREVSGVVRITCSPDVAAVVVAPMLSDLLDRYPALRIELEASESLLDLTRREADLALRTVRPTRGDLLVKKFASIEWLLVGTPALVRKLGALGAWADARWVSWGERHAGIAPARWVKARLAGSEPVVRSDSLTAQLAAVAAGVGIALIPGPTAQHHGLVPVKLKPALRASVSDWPGDDLFLVTHRALREVPRVQVLWDALSQRARDFQTARA
jgi:DNA-binding transcriptional LysR family regulator